MNGEEPRAEATGLPWKAPDEHARQIAQRTFATWRRFDVALAPIIGRGGVAALYRRSLFLTRALYPWLPGVHEGALAPVEFMDLQAAVALQPPIEAQAATDALATTFRGLLTELIGASLTERLLRPASASPSHGGAVQDDSP